MANGEIPYKDFWTIYSPAQFYVLAGLFKLFGTSLMVERVWDTLLRSLLALLIYGFASRLAPKAWAFLCWLTTIAWLWYCTLFSYPAFHAMLFSLSSIYFVYIYICTFIENQNAQSKYLLFAGLLTAITALYRHDLGFYTFISVSGTLALFSYLHFKDAENRNTSTLSGFLKHLSPYLTGFFYSIIAPTAYIAMKVPLSELYSQLLFFPAIIFPEYRQLPYPELFPLWRNLPFYLPFFIYAASLFLLLFRKNGLSNIDKNKWWALFILSAIGMLLGLQAKTRSDIYHLLPTLITSTIVLAALAQPIGRKLGAKSYIATAITLFFFAFLLAAPAKHMLVSINKNIPTSHFEHKVERASGLPLFPDLAAAIGFIREKVPENEPIFVGNPMHNKILINNTMFYFLAGRLSASKYHELHPGLATTEIVQSEIIASITENRVRRIVIFSGFSLTAEPNASSQSNGAVLLDEFIKSNYIIEQQFGDYEILKLAD